MITEFLDAIAARLGALFAPLHWIIDAAYLLEWHALLALGFLAAFFIGYFLPLKWVRIGLGIVLAIASAFVAGGTVMWKHMRRNRG